MAHPEDRSVIGLQSVDFSTPSSELFRMWSQLHIPQFENKDEHEWDRQFFRYRRLSLAASLGLPVEAELHASLVGLSDYQELGKISEICMFWYGVARNTDSPDKQFARNVWESAINLVENPYSRAEHTIEFVEQTSPHHKGNDGDWKGPSSIKIQEAAESLREVLPIYDTAGAFFTDNNGALAQLCSFVRQAQRLGFSEEVDDIHAYLVDLVAEADVSVASGFELLYILRYLARVQIDDDKKYTRVRMVYEQTKHMPSGVSARDAVLEGVIEGFLSVGEWDQAIEVWMEMKNATSVEHAISDFVIYAMNQGDVSLMRDLYPRYEKLLVRLDGQASDLHQSQWNLHWFFAARSIANNNICYLEEPEVMSAISDMVTKSAFVGLVELAAKFPQAKRLHEVIKKRVQKQIRQYNRGKMRSSDAIVLFESMIEMKRYPDIFAVTAN